MWNIDNCTLIRFSKTMVDRDVPPSPEFIDAAYTCAQVLHERDLECSTRRYGWYEITKDGPPTMVALRVKTLSYLGADEEMDDDYHATHVIQLVDQLLTNPDGPVDITDDTLGSGLELFPSRKVRFENPDAYQAMYDVIGEIFPDQEKIGPDGDIRYHSTEEKEDAMMAFDTAHFEAYGQGKADMTDAEVIEKLYWLKEFVGPLWPESIQLPATGLDGPLTDETIDLFKSLADALATHRTEKGSHWDQGEYNYSLHTTIDADGRPIHIFFARSKEEVMPNGVVVGDSENWSLHAGVDTPPEFYTTQTANSGMGVVKGDGSLDYEQRQELAKTINQENSISLMHKKANGETIADHDAIQQGIAIMKAQAEI